MTVHPEAQRSNHSVTKWNGDSTFSMKNRQGKDKQHQSSSSTSTQHPMNLRKKHRT